MHNLHVGHYPVAVDVPVEHCHPWIRSFVQSTVWFWKSCKRKRRYISTYSRITSVAATGLMCCIAVENWKDGTNTDFQQTHWLQLSKWTLYVYFYFSYTTITSEQLSCHLLYEIWGLRDYMFKLSKGECRVIVKIGFVKDLQAGNMKY